MGLEAGTYLDDLNPDWPLSTDLRRQGDDHLRLIKQTLQNSFPNIAGAMTKSHTELNAIPAQIDVVVTQLILHSMKKGMILPWDLTNNPVIPSGWAECNGQTVDGYGVVPDLRDRFLIGRSSTKDQASTGGAASVNSGSNGAHTHTINGTALTEAQIPDHGHALYVFETGSSSDANAFSSTNAKGIAGNTDGSYAYRTNTTASAGNNPLVQNDGGAADSHTHTAESNGAHTHTVDTVPPYYACIFIVKTTEYAIPL